MAQLNIELPEELQAKVRARAAETGHRSVEEYVESLILADANEVSEDYGAPSHLRLRSGTELEERLREGLSGDSTEMSAADWQRLRRQLDQTLER